MANTSLFIVNQTDFSANITVGSYNIKEKLKYKDFEDANGRTHRRFIRNQIEGKFEIFFRTMTEYFNFVNTIKAARSPQDSSVPVSVYDIDSGEIRQISAFIDFDSTINLDGTMNPFIDPFEVKVKER